MFLDVSKAFVRPMVDFDFEVEVPLEKQEVNGDEVSFEPVKLKGQYSMMDDMVRVEGTLQTVAHAPCAVCLTDASAPIEVEFAESFRKDADEEEDGFFKYEGKQLPLDHMTLTLVLLNMPMRFLCREDCKGLCPQCGVNLNTGSCTCQEGDDDTNPFAALRSMIVENNEEV